MQMPIREDQAVQQFSVALTELLKVISAAAVARLVAEMSKLPPPSGDSFKPLLLDQRQAAKALSISTGTLWNYTAPRGPIPVVKIGARSCYSVADLERAIEWLKTRPVR